MCPHHPQTVHRVQPSHEERLVTAASLFGLPSPPSYRSHRDVVVETDARTSASTNSEDNGDASGHGLSLGGRPLSLREDGEVEVDVKTPLFCLPVPDALLGES